MAIAAGNSFGTRDTLRVGAQSFEIFRLEKLEKDHGVDLGKLPFSLRILLENLLRNEDGRFVHAPDIRRAGEVEAGCAGKRNCVHARAGAAAGFYWRAGSGGPGNDARGGAAHGRKPKADQSLFPAELVIDHSVQVDSFGTVKAFDLNAELEFQRNVERYAFLRWGQTAFQNFKVVPPDTGICHQVNLEYLARVVCAMPAGNKMQAYPDSVVGTDSHTTMINALGVFGWGVGGIEAEAAMLGQPSSMLVPEVVGFGCTEN